MKITKKIPSIPVYLDERSRNPVSELNFIEFEKFATGRHPRGSKCRHRGPFRWRPRFATEWTTTVCVHHVVYEKPLQLCTSTQSIYNTKNVSFVKSSIRSIICSSSRINRLTSASSSLSNSWCFYGKSKSTSNQRVRERGRFELR